MKYLGPQDNDILAKSYDELSSDDKIPPKQYPTLEGIRNILEPLAQTDPKQKQPSQKTLSICDSLKNWTTAGYYGLIQGSKALVRGSSFN